MQCSWVAESLAGETENWGAHAKPRATCFSSGCPLKYTLEVVLTLSRNLESRPTQLPGQGAGMDPRGWVDVPNLTSCSILFGYRCDRKLR